MSGTMMQMATKLVLHDEYMMQDGKMKDIPADKK
jgi:hypothetical protein